jgi:hypothetical protein
MATARWQWLERTIVKQPFGDIEGDRHHVWGFIGVLILAVYHLFK